MSVTQHLSADDMMYVVSQYIMEPESDVMKSQMIFDRGTFGFGEIYLPDMRKYETLPSYINKFIKDNELETVYVDFIRKSTNFF